MPARSLRTQADSGSLTLADVREEDRRPVVRAAELPMMLRIVRALPIWVVVLAGAGAAIAQSPPIFLNPPTIAVPPQPTFVAAADLDQSGKLSLVVGGSGVTILQPAGTPGTFLPPAGLITAGAGYPFALGDVNGDGMVDVVTPGIPPGIQAWLNLGGANFGAPIQSPSTLGCIGPLTLGDLNGDGALDVASCICTTVHHTGVSTYFGDGAGGFSPNYTTTIAGDIAIWCSIVDFDNDGDLDLVSLDSGMMPPGIPPGLSLMLNDGTGSFAPPIGKPSIFAFEITTADVNGDGWPDVVVPLPGAQVVLNDGSGGFGASVFSSAGAALRSCATGDFNSDGVIDLVAVSKISNVAPILLGTGTGSFTISMIAPTGASPVDVAAGDLDGDGALDGVTANQAESFLSLVFGDGAGGALVPSKIDLTTATLAIDLDGNGRLDLVGSAISGLRFNHGLPGLAFTPSTFIASSVSVSEIASSDFTGDGRPDVVTAGGPVGLFVNNGSHGLDPPVFIPSGNVSTGVIVAADFDGDGKADVAASGIDQDQFAVLLGDGAGNFGSAAIHPTGAGTAPWSMAVLDSNLDGNLDLLVVCPGTSSVTLEQGLGSNGLFVPAGSWHLATEPRGIVVGDFNFDGRVDAAIGNSNSVTILLAGSGGFVASSFAVPGSASSPMRSLACSDFDGDGRLDLLVASENTASFFLATGHGDGTFDAPSSFTGGFPLVAADFDADGAVDVVAAGVVQKNLSVPPAGLSTFGAGTHGCAGSLGIGGTSSPSVGSSLFQLRFTQAPAGSVGLALVTDVSSPGVDPFGLGCEFLVDLIASTQSFALNAFVDVTGTGLAPAPIPNLPALANQIFYAQGVFLWTGTCHPSPFSLSTSAGLKLTIQP